MAFLQQPKQSGTYYSGNVGVTGGNPPLQSGYLDDVRRTYDFGDRIAGLFVEPTPFLTYLQKMQTVPTPDPKFMFLEERQQWQRRYFTAKQAHSGVNNYNPANDLTLSGLRLTTEIDKFGRVTEDDNIPGFLQENQVISLQVKVTGDTASERYGTTATTVPANALITAINNNGTDYASVDVKVLAVDGYEVNATNFPNGKYRFQVDANTQGEVMGSSWGEGTGGPNGWVDQLFDRVGYCQLFKTAIPMFTGTSMATELRGRKSDFTRTWKNAIMSHKADITRAYLFGTGGYADVSTPLSSNNDRRPGVRHTWGMIPFLKRFGVNRSWAYNSFKYDTVIDFMKAFVDEEKGMMNNNVVMLVSRKTMAFFHKLTAASGFIPNTIASIGSSYGRYNIGELRMGTGTYGHRVTSIDTYFGTINLMVEHQLRRQWEDYSLILTLDNITHRPLQGNGYNRDYIVKTNVQENDIDGRQDQMLSECGLEVALPETHALIKWS